MSIPASKTSSWLCSQSIPPSGPTAPRFSPCSPPGPRRLALRDATRRSPRHSMDAAMSKPGWKRPWPRASPATSPLLWCMEHPAWVSRPSFSITFRGLTVARSSSAGDVTSRNRCLTRRSTAPSTRSANISLLCPGKTFPKCCPATSPCWRSCSQCSIDSTSASSFPPPAPAPAMPAASAAEACRRCASSLATCAANGRSFSPSTTFNGETSTASRFWAKSSPRRTLHRYWCSAPIAANTGNAAPAWPRSSSCKRRIRPFAGSTSRSSHSRPRRPTTSPSPCWRIRFRGGVDLR